MNARTRLVALVALAFFSLPAPAVAADLHVSPSGDDSGPGSLQRPWRTLARATRADLEPGDRVLLEGGTTLSGTLALDSGDAGTAQTPVVVGT